MATFRRHPTPTIMLRRFAPALLACLAATTSQAASPRAAATIELVPAADLWEVRYTLPAPARELRFARANGKGHRAATWTPVDAQWEITTEGEEEIVRRRDGKPFDHAAFRMAPRYAVLEKDYAPFSPFGDGGMLVYTGQFHACAGACSGGETHALRLQPPAAAHAIVHGKVVDAVDFVDEADGTNLYIGRATPVDTPDVVAVIDQAFPADTRARLESLLPRLMAFYGSEFGALPSRPMLYASRDENHPGGGYGYQGGTLPGQVFMHFYGRHAAFATPEFAARVDWFFAHEAAHLYQRYTALADEGDSWIHEGGADALAAVGLQALGVVDEQAVQARLQQAVANCAKGIGGHPLKQAHATGSFEAMYACGFVLQMAVDSAARRASGGACGLACVWRDFQQDMGAGKPWSRDTFITAATARTDAATGAFLRRVVDEVAPQPEAILREGLAKAGRVLPAP
jgi:hypothetical protein